MPEQNMPRPEQDLVRLGMEFVRLRTELKKIKETQTAIQNEFDTLRKTTIPKVMEDSNINGMNITGVGRLGLRSEAYASVVKDMKEEAHEWLTENGFGDIIKEAVNSSSLKALLKEQVEEGVEIPDDIFNFTPYMMATITKS